MFNSNGIKTFNIHPLAWQQQKLMLSELKEMQDCVETEIHHHYDKTSNSVSWYYNFNDESNISWEEKVRAVIKKHERSV
jgi:hypothetical protein